MRETPMHEWGVENASPEDRERMERLSREAEGILFADEVTRHIREDAEEETVAEEAVEKGRGILEREAGKDVAFVEREFNEIFQNPEFTKELFSKFEHEFGWQESKTRAMLGVLRHTLNELYYRSSFRPADEFNPHPEGQTRDTRENLLSIISDDYNVETMREVEPLVNLYLAKAYALIMEHKKGTAGASEEE